MIDAFGVDRPDLVAKYSTATRERARHYGAMSGTLGTLGGTSTALATGSGVVGHMERKGKDPMGFTQRETASQKPLSEGARMRVLKPMARAHFWQAKGLGVIGAGATGAAVAYRHKRRQELGLTAKAFVPSPPTSQKKRSNLNRVAGAELGIGSAALGGAALHYGGKQGNMLRRQAGIGLHEARASHHLIQAHKMGEVDIDPHELKFARNVRRMGARVAGVKGTGALAAGVATAAGGAGLYEMGRYHAAQRRKQFGKATPPIRILPRQFAVRAQQAMKVPKKMTRKQKVLVGGGAAGVATPLGVAAGMDEYNRRKRIT